MRKIVCTLFSIIFVTSAFCQETKDRRFEIKTNLLNLIAAGPSAAAEYNLRNNRSIMLSVAAGHIDYGDFGGITKYKTTTLEYRKYFADNILFVGPYIKNIQKQVLWQQSYLLYFTIGQDRDFKGNGLSAGTSFGAKFRVSRKARVEINYQMGVGRYYNMRDKYGNLPSGNYFDTSIGIWFGFRI